VVVNWVTSFYGGIDLVQIAFQNKLRERTVIESIYTQDVFSCQQEKTYFFSFGLLRVILYP
jgi:hypothetical protein